MVALVAKPRRLISPFSTQLYLFDSTTTMGLAKCLAVCLRYFLTVIGWITNPLLDKIFSLIYDGSSKIVPTVEDDILLQSAVNIANKIRSRELQAEDVMQRHIARVQQVNDDVNCVIAERYEEALSEARELDKELDKNASDERNSNTNMPFLGVPLSVKEAFAVKGMPNTSGLVVRKGLRCETDCPVVVRLRRAGAIPFCMTNTSELCMWYESANRLYGRTRNPYNTARIVGGSSGGEACNIATGGATFGIGSDIGGSIRMPAFFNGIFGHRSSRDLVPNEGQFPIATGTDLALMSTGPMCRYASDLLPMLKVMAGTSPQADLTKQVDVASVHVYNIVDDGGSVMLSSVDGQLKKAQAQVADYLKTTAGCRVDTITIPKFRYALDIWVAKMTNTGGQTFCELMGNCERSINPFTELLKALVGMSNHTLPAIALGLLEKTDFLMESANQRALQGFDKLEEEISELLTGNTVIIYPTHPKLAPYHNQPFFYPFNWAYTGLFNTLGLPVTQVPLGLSKNGLPMGVQIVGGMNNDAVTVAVAEELARAKIARWVNPGQTAECT